MFINTSNRRNFLHHIKYNIVKHKHKLTNKREMFATFTLFIYVTLLVNLSPNPVIASSSLVASSPSSQAAAAATAATMSQQQQQQQQQQSNSVIQYPTTPNTATKPRYKTMYACEDRQLTIDCETGSKINLIRANFGRFSITQCNEQGQLDLQTDCMSRTTFRIMEERCQNKQRCSVNATSTLFGDRCPKTRKYLEVHFQCQATNEPDMVDVRKPISPMPMNPSPVFGVVTGPLKPPNNPTSVSSPSIPIRSAIMPSQHQQQQQNNYQPAYQEDTPSVANSLSSTNDMIAPSNQNNQQPQMPTPVINSPLMSSVNAISTFDNPPAIVVSLRHLQMENMSRPRCHQWDNLANQWTERGAKILETNQTHTTCVFDQVTSYVLVMDYSGPMQTISPMNINNSNNISKQSVAVTQPSANPIFNSAPPDFLENQPIPIDNFPQQNAFLPPSQFDINKIIHPPTPTVQQQQQQQQQQQLEPISTKMFSLFGYLLAVIFVVIGLLTLAFVASSMRSSAGAALKSLGNFAPFNGPKYNKRRKSGNSPPSLHSNKDLLVINNSDGHQFIYAPASTTKISNSSSTHILSAGQPTGLAGQHSATLHRIQQQQQQQMYSGNGATLSSLSGTGAQSNNYYYGLMGLNPLFQQQQTHHFSQHHLNEQQQHQAQIATNYSHQVNNKSSMSAAESANSSSSSSGIESKSTSMSQQQQQACLVSTSNQGDFNLMSHHLSSNYGQHQQQPNMFSHQQQQQQQQLAATPTTPHQHHHQQQQQQHHNHAPGAAMTLNAHYSTSGELQSINMSPNMTSAATLHNRQASSQLRDHIYECVEDVEKPYMVRQVWACEQMRKSGRDSDFVKWHHACK